MRISVPVNHNFYEEAPIYESELSKKFTVEKVGDKKYLQQLFSSVYELKLGAEQLKQIRIFNFKRRRLFDPDEERLILKLYSKEGISRKLMETKFHFTAPSKVAFPVSHNKRGFLSGNFRNS